jgi:putative membrane protein
MTPLFRPSRTPVAAPVHPAAWHDASTRRHAWRTRAAWWLAAALGLAACSTTPAPAVPPLAEADRAFMLEAARSALFAINAGKVVEQLTANAPLKAYAAQTVKDRQAADAELRQLADARGLALPEASAPEQQAPVEAMKALPPSELDQRYVQQVAMAALQADLALHQGMAARARDPALRAWAMRTLAVLREHQAAAQRLPVTVQARWLGPAAPR